MKTPMIIYARKYPGTTLVELLMSILISTMIVMVIIFLLIASTQTWQACTARSIAFPPAYYSLSRINADLRNAAYITLPPTWAIGTSYSVGNYSLNNGIYYICTSSNTASGSNAPGTPGGGNCWTITPSWIVIYPPQLDNSDPTHPNLLAIPVLPATSSGAYLNVKEYYISDSTGASNRPGSYLWLRLFNEDMASGAMTVLSSKVVAQNVEQLSFTPDATLSGAGSIQASQQILAVHSTAISTIGQEGKDQVLSSFASSIVVENPTTAHPPTPNFP